MQYLSRPDISVLQTAAFPRAASDLPRDLYPQDIYPQQDASLDFSDYFNTPNSYTADPLEPAAASNNFAKTENPLSSAQISDAQMDSAGAGSEAGDKGSATSQVAEETATDSQRDFIEGVPAKKEAQAQEPSAEVADAKNLPRNEPTTKGGLPQEGSHTGKGELTGNAGSTKVLVAERAAEKSAEKATSQATEADSKKATKESAEKAADTKAEQIASGSEDRLVGAEGGREQKVAADAGEANQKNTSANSREGSAEAIGPAKSPDEGAEVAAKNGNKADPQLAAANKASVGAANRPADKSSATHDQAGNGSGGSSGDKSAGSSGRDAGSGSPVLASLSQQSGGESSNAGGQQATGNNEGTLSNLMFQHSDHSSNSNVAELQVFLSPDALSPGGGEVAPARMSTAELMDQFKAQFRQQLGGDIVRQARYVLRGQNSGEISLVLKPEKLGRLRIRLSMEDKSIGAKIFVENKHVQEAFTELSEDLRQAFAEQGFENLNLDISLDEETQNVDDTVVLRAESGQHQSLIESQLEVAQAYIGEFDSVNILV